MNVICLYRLTECSHVDFDDEMLSLNITQRHDYNAKHRINFLLYRWLKRVEGKSLFWDFKVICPIIIWYVLPQLPEKPVQ